MVLPKVLGKAATMLTKINKDAPLPIPRSVIISEIHMTNIAPAVRAKVVSATKANPGSIAISGLFNKVDVNAVLWIIAPPRAT